MTEPTSGGVANEDRPVSLDDGDDVDALVAAHDLVLVDFYTKGCTLCQSIEPVVGNVARATDAVVGTCNPRDDLDLVERFDIRSVPTLVLFRDGEVVGRLADGFRGTDAVVSFVEEHATAGTETETDSESESETETG